MEFDNEYTIFGSESYSYAYDASLQIHVTIPQPQPEPDTETNDDEVDSITRGILQMNRAETESIDSSSKKRKRPESPELWLYDGNMV